MRPPLLPLATLALLVACADARREREGRQGEPLRASISVGDPRRACVEMATSVGYEVRRVLGERRVSGGVVVELLVRRDRRERQAWCTYDLATGVARITEGVPGT
ncbi:MAG TPA: hypothetical protein VFG43_15815 [Geminicoccaceae bacterium]|nr:hypothetical protein [Geminicoccaceae bacterium]